MAGNRNRRRRNNSVRGRNHGSGSRGVCVTGEKASVMTDTNPIPVQKKEEVPNCPLFYQLVEEFGFDPLVREPDPVDAKYDAAKKNLNNLVKQAFLEAR